MPFLVATPMLDCEGSANVLGFSPATDAFRIRDRVGYMPEKDSYLAGMTAGELARIKDSVEDSDDWSLKGISQEFLGKFEKRLLRKVLDSTNWNRRKAAELLDISYKSLLNKIKDYDLTEVG